MDSKIELKVPSQLDFLGIPDAVLMEVASDLPYAQKSIDELGTAVIEACTNAMEHGNRLQDNHPIHVTFEFSENVVVVTVVDDGPGFDFSHWKPPTDLMRERGRGILIMREFTDELVFESLDDGRFSVRLVKHLQPADEA